ncbi:MAG: MFS transporter [bacterium]
MERPFSSGPLRGVTPNLVKLGVVSFLADVSSEMLYPVIPLFMTVTLGAPVALLGVIEGIAEGTSSLLKYFSGRWSDRAGKRRSFVIAGYFASALGRILLALSYIWPAALLARTVDRFGKGLRTSPRDALISDSVPPEYKGKAFGIHRAMDTMGAIIGPLIALALISAADDNLRLVLWLAVLPGIAAAFFLFLVREIGPSGKAPEAGIRFHDLPRAFRAYLVPVGIFALVNSSDMFLLLKAKDAGFSAAGVILLYISYNVIYAAGSPFLGRLSDRVGRKSVLVGGMVVFALVYTGFALANAPWHLWALFAVYGLYISATEVVGKAFAADLVPSALRGSAMGALGLISGIGAIFASAIGGALWTAVAPWATFAYGAAGATTAALLISRLGLYLPEKKSA